MARPKRLTSFVEGKGDPKAIDVLIRRLLREMDPPPYDVLVPDDDPPFRVGNLPQLVPWGRHKTPDFTKWQNFLRAASTSRKPLGAVLLLLDGDTKEFDSQPFCPGVAAKRVAAAAVEAGGGSQFSVAVAFAVKEFETWLVAGFDSLPGRKAGYVVPSNYDQHRNAKKHLQDGLKDGDKPTLHQAGLVQAVDLNLIRKADLRSFRRLENALSLLVAACRSGTHIVSP